MREDTAFAVLGRATRGHPPGRPRGSRGRVVRSSARPPRPSNRWPRPSRSSNGSTAGSTRGLSATSTPGRPPPPRPVRVAPHLDVITNFCRKSAGPNPSPAMFETALFLAHVAPEGGDGRRPLSKRHGGRVRRRDLHAVAFGGSAAEAALRPPHRRLPDSTIRAQLPRILGIRNQGATGCNLLEDPVRKIIMDDPSEPYGEHRQQTL